MSKEINVILYGATGLIGSGVLIECIEDPQIKSVLVIGRSSCGVKDPKVKEILLKDFNDYSQIEDQLQGYNACFFCLGISSYKMTEEDYTRITYGYTESAVDVLSKINPEMTFSFISGQGTDDTEKSSTMWQRVKGQAENKVKNTFSNSYLFRPGYIQPMKGVRSRTPIYNTIYAIFAPLYPILKRLFPKSVTTSEALGKAMIRSATIGYENQILDNNHINTLASR